MTRATRSRRTSSRLSPSRLFRMRSREPGGPGSRSVSGRKQPLEVAQEGLRDVAPVLVEPFESGGKPGDQRGVAEPVQGCTGAPCRGEQVERDGRLRREEPEQLHLF